jgi:hypothetical protein
MFCSGGGAEPNKSEIEADNHQILCGISGIHSQRGTVDRETKEMNDNESILTVTPKASISVNGPFTGIRTNETSSTMEVRKFNSRIFRL